MREFNTRTTESAYLLSFAHIATTVSSFRYVETLGQAKAERNSIRNKESPEPGTQRVPVGNNSRLSVFRRPVDVTPVMARSGDFQYCSLEKNTSREGCQDS